MHAHNIIYIIEHTHTHTHKSTHTHTNPHMHAHMTDLVPKGAQEKRTEVLENKVDRM